MRWQRVAQAAIALFVIGFVAILGTTLRKESAAPRPAPTPPREDDKAQVENRGGCEQIEAASGKLVFSIKCGKHFAYADGRQKLSDGVTIDIPRDGKMFHLESREADVTVKESAIGQAVFRGDVRLKGDNGLEVRGAEATYTDSDGILAVPGAVEFTNGRLKGTGVGARYDRTRETLWILDKAQFHVDADPKNNQGPIEGTAASIGMAKTDHYVRLERDARLVSDNRTLQADTIGIRLTPDDQRIQSVELRVNSRISGGTGGPQDMAARDIDLTYGGDGRTLQQAKLVEGASMQLAGAAGGAGKRISGTTIDVTLGPDGSTVTRLVANDRVQVDLPAEAKSPAKQIRSATLVAEGSAGGGLQNAVFGGGAQYCEARAAVPASGSRASRGPSGPANCDAPAGRGTNASARTSRSDSLVLATAPGFGAIQQAEFRGNVKFRDDPDFSAEAPLAIYHVERDRLQLLPGDALPGPQPLVTDGKVSVAARTLDMTVSTRELTAETRVRSTMLPQKGGAAKSGGKVPSLLKQDEPVTVTSNRLRYQGNASSAEYTGNAMLWQGETQIKGETILVDDQQGNLTGKGNVTTRFFIDEVDRKTNERRQVETKGSAENFVYTDARRLATYTGKARLIGAQGDVTGDRIELFIKAGVNELEKAEAYGSEGAVTVQQGMRSGTGNHLTYTAATDEYLMTGAPVEIIEEKKGGGCVRILGATARFNRTAESARVDGSGVIPQEQKSIPCPQRGSR